MGKFPQFSIWGSPFGMLRKTLLCRGYWPYQTDTHRIFFHLNITQWKRKLIVQRSTSMTLRGPPFPHQPLPWIKSTLNIARCCLLLIQGFSIFLKGWNSSDDKANPALGSTFFLIFQQSEWMHLVMAVAVAEGVSKVLPVLPLLFFEKLENIKQSLNYMAYQTDPSMFKARKHLNLRTATY